MIGRYCDNMTEITVVYVAETVAYDSSWILGIFTTRAGAIEACREFIDKKIEDFEEWPISDTDTYNFAQESIEYYTMLQDKDFFDNTRFRDGSIDSPVIRIYELDRYIE
jgi:hypothetical protein